MSANSTIMRRGDFRPTFLTCEKDMEVVLRKIFVESNPYSEKVKRLLVLNTKDCLDNTTSQVYRDKINEMSLAKLKEDGYIRIVPGIKFPEHEEIKTYIVVSFDNFYQTSNREFRENTISLGIFSHPEYWDLGNFRLRPLKMAGYIDGILNRSRLTGIGQLEFVSCSEIVLDENLSGYSLIYRAVHGGEDKVSS